MQETAEMIFCVCVYPNDNDWACILKFQDSAHSLNQFFALNYP